jgi:hypothetical protein
MRPKLYQTKWRATAALRFTSDLENALVKRVRRRICMRIVRFWRSTYEVLTFDGSGLPTTVCASVLVIFGGEYLPAPTGEDRYTFINCAKSTSEAKAYSTAGGVLIRAASVLICGSMPCDRVRRVP